MQCSKGQKTSGFTIVEMLVVAPMIVIIIGVLIAAMVSLTSSVVVSNAEGSATYDVQSALDQIEQDVRLSTSFGVIDDMTLVPTTTPILILGQYATDRNPTDPNRELIYTSIPGNPCNTTDTLNGKLWRSNPPVKISIIYHIVDGTLWRRTIIPSDGVTFSATSPAANTVCGQIWQRSTCIVKNDLTWPCSAANTDTRVLTNVASSGGFVLQYFNSIASTSGSSSPSTSTSAVKVTLKTTSSVAGQDVIATGSMKAKITNY